MGLLTTLDFHKCSLSGTTEKSIEVEFQLYSWGEIYPPFPGDREHSIAARYILPDFPLKLLSSSTPYETLPQKLCLTFKAFEEVKVDKETHRVSGLFPRETAEEFTAFLSLITRRRIFVSKQIRYDSLPIEEEMPYRQSNLQMHQRLREIDPKRIYRLLDNLQGMDRRIGDSFILATRLYHSAVKMLYTEPEFAYLFLVMSLEAISSAVHRDLKPSDIEGNYIDRYLDSTYPRWRQLCNISTPERKSKVEEMLLSEAYITRRKFSKFVEENTPERFWSETEDDAKPDYLTSEVWPVRSAEGFGADEQISHSDITIHDKERIKKENLRQVLKNVYDTRSKLIHTGERLPTSIVIGLLPKIPYGDGSTFEKQLPIPPILTFERLVSYSMTEFLCKQTDPDI